MSGKISPPPRTPELTEAYKELRDAHRSIGRFIAAGNSGGVVAAISLIGTIYGSQNGGPIPQGAFWLLVVFLIGLLAALGRLMFEAHMLERATIEGESQRLDRPLPAVYRTLVWTSVIALVVGILGSLVSLYGLTGSASV